MKEKHKLLLLLLISGITTGLSVTFSKYFGFIEWVSMIPLVFALVELTKKSNLKLRHAYFYGVFYFECFYLVCFHFFLYLYPLDFTGLNNFYSVIVIAIAWLGLSFLQALFGGLVFIAYVSLSRRSITKKFPLINVVSLPLIYTFYEFTQTLGWWGVPWGRLALGQVDMILPIQTASLFGSYFVTAIIVLVNSLLAFAMMNSESVGRDKKYALVALSVFLSNIVLGAILYKSAEDKADKAESVTVGVIQGNYDSTAKWTATKDSILYDHLELTEEAVKDGAEIVLWAETALPYTLRDDDIEFYELEKAAKALNVTILVGAMERIDGDKYNTLFCFLPDGTAHETRYYKRHLVPFGEYVPLRRFMEKTLPFMADISMFEDDMRPGKDTGIIEVDEGKIGSLICFDSIYETLSKRTVNDGAELIMLSTNDSWFTDSAGIYMHNNQARLRAVEFGRFITRSANTGLSSFISNSGELISDIEPLTRDALTEEVKILNHTTLYSVIGNTFVYLSVTLVSIPFIYDLVIHIIERKRQNCKQTLTKSVNNNENK